MKVVILVPIRYGKQERDKLWKFCRPRWETHFPDWEIHEGIHTASEGLFNRSKAINRASVQAGEWDVALIIDNDIAADPRAVTSAVDVAAITGRLVVAHDRRIMLNETGTSRILAGHNASWSNSRFVEQIWYDSVSCAVAVNRETWDRVNGFDERFVGWGREDTGFQIACEAVSSSILRVEGDTFHLWHPISPEAKPNSPVRLENEKRHKLYVDARWDLEKVMGLIATPVWEPIVWFDNGWGQQPIPKIIHRTVPEKRSVETDQYWEKFKAMYGDWDLRSWEEPLNSNDFPVTSPLWDLCDSGAQKAGLIRLELLWAYGGVYVDSDVEPLRRMDELLSCKAFAAWEDANCVPDAVLGAVPGHPAVAEMLNMAAERLIGGADAWHTGPGVTTAVLPNREDTTVLSPGAFYPYHYLEKAARSNEKFAETAPWAYSVHHWAHSWGTPEQKAQLVKKQR